MITYLRKHGHSRENIEKIYRAVTGWLAGLHACGNNRSCSARDVFANDHITRSLQLFKEKYGLSSEEYRLIGRLFEVDGSLEGGSIPLGFVHGDFSPWNVRFNAEDGNISVLDWEYARTTGIPIVDLLNFFVVSHAVLSGRETSGNRTRSSFSLQVRTPLPELDNFQKAFFDDSWLAQLTRTCIMLYCKKTAVHTPSLGIFFLVFILNHLGYRKDFLEFFLQHGVPLSFE
jgi:thiamine kinase-like enzyme